MRPPIKLAIALLVWDLFAYFTGITAALVFLMLATGQHWKWLITPDVAPPGDLTLPEVKAVYDKYGEFWCAWYWLAVRNRWKGLDFVFARRLPLAWDQSKMGVQTQGDLWWERKPILNGKYQIKRGWRLVVVNGVPYGTPCWTITVA